MREPVRGLFEAPGPSQRMETVMSDCASTAAVWQRQRQYGNDDKDNKGSILVAPVLLLVADIAGELDGRE